MEIQKVLANIHQLQYPDKGQNYVFNGCMKYLMECLGEKEEYDYYFFSFISGDCVTQVFGQSKDRWYSSFSQSLSLYCLRLILQKILGGPNVLARNC